MVPGHHWQVCEFSDAYSRPRHCAVFCLRVSMLLASEQGSCCRRAALSPWRIEPNRAAESARADLPESREGNLAGCFRAAVGNPRRRMPHAQGFCCHQPGLATRSSITRTQRSIRPSAEGSQAAHTTHPAGSVLRGCPLRRSCRCRTPQCDPRVSRWPGGEQ